jgi:hypothetical protein
MFRVTMGVITSDAQISSSLVCQTFLFPHLFSILLMSFSKTEDLLPFLFSVIFVSFSWTRFLQAFRTHDGVGLTFHGMLSIWSINLVDDANQVQNMVKYIKWKPWCYACLIDIWLGSWLKNKMSFSWIQWIAIL